MGSYVAQVGFIEKGITLVIAAGTANDIDEGGFSPSGTSCYHIVFAFKEYAVLTPDAAAAGAVCEGFGHYIEEVDELQWLSIYGCGCCFGMSRPNVFNSSIRVLFSVVWDCSTNCILRLFPVNFRVFSGVRR